MKPRKNTVLILLLGLLLFAFSVAMAQTPSQGDQKKSEACCAMESCCCNGGSCSGDSCAMKKHDGKNHGAKSDCCKAKQKSKTKV